MRLIDNNTKAFLALARAGLWSDGIQKILVGATTEWNVVYQLAQEQSVLGLVLAGLEHSDLKPSQELLLQWIGEVQLIEQRNKAMNKFVVDLIDRLRKANIYCLLVKGQGVAQCYDKPLWRVSGDIDLLLSSNSYQKAYENLVPLASKVDREKEYTKHQALTIYDWEVELHGTLRSGLGNRIDKVIDEVQCLTLTTGGTRIWNINDKQICPIC